MSLPDGNGQDHIDDDERTAGGDDGAPAAAPAEVEPDEIDVLVDRWFGEYSIPNHFEVARSALKERLKAWRAKA